MRTTSDEIFDVVDEQDRVIGQAPRGMVHRDGLLHRAVHIFAFNSSGELFLQRRALCKDSAPGLWSSSCSGHVDANETYEQAAIRELGEEIGLVLDLPELVLRLKVTPCKETENEFVQLFYCSSSTPLQLDPIEVMDGRWISKLKLEAWVDREPKAFAPSFIHLYAMDRLIHQVTLP